MTILPEKKMKDTTEKVLIWADERGLLERENVPKQFLKVSEEIGELAAAISRDKKEAILDGLGDSFVTLIILSAQLGINPEKALESAYDEIKNRKGKTENGIFIKQDDLSDIERD